MGWFTESEQIVSDGGREEGATPERHDGPVHAEAASCLACQSTLYGEQGRQI